MNSQPCLQLDLGLISQLVPCPIIQSFNKHSPSTSVRRDAWPRGCKVSHPEPVSWAPGLAWACWGSLAFLNLLTLLFHPFWKHLSLQLSLFCLFHQNRPASSPRCPGTRYVFCFLLSRGCSPQGPGFSTPISSPHPSSPWRAQHPNPWPRGLHGHTHTLTIWLSNLWFRLGLCGGPLLPASPALPSPGHCCPWCSCYFLVF